MTILKDSQGNEWEPYWGIGLPLDSLVVVKRPQKRVPFEEVDKAIMNNHQLWDIRVALRRLAEEIVKEALAQMEEGK